MASAAERRPSQNPIICPGNIFFAILSTPWSGARDYFWPALLCAKRLRICHNKCFSMIKFWTVTIQFVSVRACVRRYARTLACKHDTNQSLIGLTIVWCGSLICDEILVWNCTFLNTLLQNYPAILICRKIGGRISALFLFDCPKNSPIKPNSNTQTRHKPVAISLFPQLIIDNLSWALSRKASAIIEFNRTLRWCTTTFDGVICQMSYLIILTFLVLFTSILVFKIYFKSNN